MAEYQSQPELNKEKIKEIAREYWAQHSALEKSEKDETKKMGGKGKLFEEFYEKCGRDDKILMAVGIEMVSLYKADNKKEEGEKSEDALSQELADLNNFPTKLPHGQQRKDFFPGGITFESFKKLDCTSELGFIKGNGFFTDMLRRMIWKEMDKPDGVVDVGNLGKKIVEKRTLPPFTKEELGGLEKMSEKDTAEFFRNRQRKTEYRVICQDPEIKQGLEIIYKALRRAGYSRQDLIR